MDKQFHIPVCQGRLNDIVEGKRLWPWFTVYSSHSFFFKEDIYYILGSMAGSRETVVNKTGFSALKEYYLLSVFSPLEFTFLCVKGVEKNTSYSTRFTVVVIIVLMCRLCSLDALAGKKD